jgi:uncharacterized protein (DUF1697 family)
MVTIISLLRGVNVAHRRLKMSELAELYATLGFTNVRTYIQSGNVVFSNSQKDESHLAHRIHNAIRTKLRLDVTVFLRTPEELDRLVKKNPFTGNDQSRMHVTFLYTKPTQVPSDEIAAVAAKDEKLSIFDREVFLFLPNGQGRTKLSNSFFEKLFKVPATTRNWNTVLALLELARESS